MGARLGRYVILKHLASGGMADVLLARTGSMEGFERHVVVKRIRPELAHDRRFIRMLLDEARVAATLHHQNIAQVHDVGEADGEYFIAMEYVHGEDVRRLLEAAARQRSHVPLGHAVAIVSAAAAGLHHAHERLGSDRRPLHIVHRDVSPSNILIGYDGAIKVVDFGIATASLQREALGHGLTGKLAYMSPEQCTLGAVDRRTDVYGLGVVLYELATTTPMIQGDGDRQVIDHVVHGRIVPPRNRRLELPRELSDIILRALATEPEQRYATADDLRFALDQFASAAGLTASASSLAAYLRLQFGERPEPWLDLGDLEADDFDEMSVSHVAPIAAHDDWDETPRSTDPHHHAGAVSHRRDSLGGIAGDPESAGQRAPSGPPATRARWRALALIGPAAAAAIAAAIWFATSVLVPRPPTGTAPAAKVVADASAATALPRIESLPIAPRATATPPDALAAALPDDASGIAEAASARGERAPAPSRRAIGDGPGRPRPERPLRVATVGPRGAEASSARSRSERAEREAAAAPEAPVPDNAAAPAGEPLRPAPTPPEPLPAPPAAPAPSPVASPPGRAAAPRVISPAVLEANRIAGDKTIAPDAGTQDAIARAGSDAVVSTYKVCVAADGEVSLVTQLRSSGFAAYDEKIRTTIRATWRYRPFVLDGAATPVCTALRFVYSQS
jgi:serine/threonine protein kinase